MQDELLLRQWSANHGQFSADLNRLFGRIGGWMARRARTRTIIDPTYATGARPADPALSSAANTLLSGLAAVLTTVVLFGTVSVVVTPSPEPGPSQASAALALGYELA